MSLSQNTRLVITQLCRAVFASWVLISVFCVVLGLTAEGIYRRTGQNAVITQLLSLFNSGQQMILASACYFCQ